MRARVHRGHEPRDEEWIGAAARHAKEVAALNFLAARHRERVRAQLEAVPRRIEMHVGRTRAGRAEQQENGARTHVANHIARTPISPSDSTSSEIRTPGRS